MIIRREYENKSKMLKYIFLIITILILSSCIYIPKIPEIKDKNLAKRLDESNQYRQQRRLEANLLTLAEKEYYLLYKFQQDFIIYDEFLVKRYNYKDNSRVSAHIDESALYLAYLANRVKSLEETKYYEKAAIKIIEGIYYLDSLNQLDGYLPRYVELKNNRFIIGDDTIRTNSYAILFFAYYQAYQNFNNPQIKKLIKNHIELIVKYYLKNDLDLYTNQGVYIKYSSLKSKLLSHQLSALLIFEVANIISTDEKLKKQIQQKLKFFIKKGYKKKNKLMNVGIGPWQLSSHSSNWLNMLKLYILVLATNDEIYKTNFKNLYNILAEEDNIFFTLLYADIFRISPLEKRKIIKVLSTYPLTINNKEIINSKRAEVTLDKFPKIIKNKRYTEGKSALAIFDRPAVYFEWKNNQHRLDANFGATGNIEFSGLDFMLAYAMFLNPYISWIH